MGSETLDDADTSALLKLANRLHELPGNPIVQHEYMLRVLCRDDRCGHRDQRRSG